MNSVNDGDARWGDGAVPPDFWETVGRERKFVSQDIPAEVLVFDGLGKHAVNVGGV